MEKKKVACTIASKNYLYYVRSVRDSFLKSNPDTEFYILLVDEVAGDFDIEPNDNQLVYLMSAIPKFFYDVDVEKKVKKV